MDDTVANFTTVWFVVFVFGMVTFAAMVLVCGIRGFSDILDLFRTLREDDEVQADGVVDE